MAHDAHWAHNTVGVSNTINALGRKLTLDGYHTPKIATTSLLAVEKFNRRIWEPANGYHRISRVLEKAGHRVYTSDIKRWCKKTRRKRAFQSFKKLPYRRGCDIITNPPFRQAQEFVETALRLLKTGGKLALLLRLQFLEGKKRKLLYAKHPPKLIWVFSFRLPRMHRFGWKGKKGGTVLAFAWFIWQKGYTGETQVRWL